MLDYAPEHTLKVSISPPPAVVLCFDTGGWRGGLSSLPLHLCDSKQRSRLNKRGGGKVQETENEITRSLKVSTQVSTYSISGEGGE